MTAVPAPPATPRPDICIVGSGPVGIAMALACAEQGRSVLLVESGDFKETRHAAGLSDADICTPARHAPMRIAARRAFGGTAAWWGGRCVPYDPVDFSIRPWLPDARWPISFEEVHPWFAAATAFFGCEPSNYQSRESPWALEGVSFRDLERWAPSPDMAQQYRLRLQALGVVIATRTTVTDIVPSACGAQIDCLRADAAGRETTIRADNYVLACGGLETTRLLLNAQERRPDLFGGSEGALGRFYAGHMSGKLADIVFDRPEDARHTDYFRDGAAFARRRFTLTPETQAGEQLLNTAFWTDNPPFHDPGHGNGALSLVWMALAIPPVGRRLLSDGVRISHVGPAPHRWGRHMLNVVRRPDRLVREVIAILRSRVFGRPHQPGFLLHSGAGRYALHYHAEQSPNRESRVALSRKRDVVGMARLEIDLLFSEADANSILKSHEILDRALRSAGVGRLDFKAEPGERVALIMNQAADGFHQTGTTRMSARPEEGVVNAECRVHGLGNLYVVASSVFPSSSQANPTLLAVALGLRLAASLSNPSNGV